MDKSLSDSRHLFHADLWGPDKLPSPHKDGRLAFSRRVKDKWWNWGQRSPFEWMKLQKLLRLVSHLNPRHAHLPAHHSQSGRAGNHSSNWLKTSLTTPFTTCVQKKFLLSSKYMSDEREPSAFQRLEMKKHSVLWVKAGVRLILLLPPVWP